MPQLLFGGILAVILLVFYGWSLYDAIDALDKSKPFPEPMQILLNSIGGLISATVVGVLGSTTRGDFPAQKALEKNLSGYVSTVAGYMPSVFILFWIVCGVITFIYGYILYPSNDPVPALNTSAKVWLGTAIASVYAYFGITPDPPNQL